MNSRTWRNSYWPCFIEVSAHTVLSLLDQNPVLEKAKQIASKKQRLPFSLLSLSYSSYSLLLVISCTWRNGPLFCRRWRVGLGNLNCCYRTELYCSSRIPISMTIVHHHPQGVAWECVSLLLLSPGIRVQSQADDFLISERMYHHRPTRFPSAIYRPCTYEGGRVIIQLTWDGVTQ